MKFYILLLFVIFSCTKNKEPLNQLEKENANIFWNHKISFYLDDSCYNVMTAFFDKDPIEEFKTELRTNKDFYLKSKSPKEISIRFAWEQIFKKITGYDTHSLLSKNCTDSTSGGRSNIFKKEWLVTKHVRLFDDRKYLVWSIPIDKKADEETYIKLSLDNAITYEKLEKIYDSILK